MMMETKTKTTTKRSKGSYMRTIYFDCETHLITPSRPVPPLVCMQYAVDDGDPTIVLADEARRLFYGWLQDKSVRLVAHNGFFDASVLYAGNHHAAWPFVQAIHDGRYRDTMIMGKLHAIQHAWIQDKSARFSLDYLYNLATGQHLAGKTGPDVWRLRYAELDGVPVAQWPAAAVEYALMDITALRTVYKAMTVQDYADEIPQTRKAWDLRGAGDWGLRTDPKQRADLQARLEPAVAAAKADLVAAGLFRLPETEFDDDAFTADVIGRCDMLGLPVQRTPGGKVSKAAKFLSSIGIGDLQQYRKQPEGYVKNTAKIRELVECAFADVPITANGNVATARKWLRESDNEHLIKLADVGEAETILNTFIPALSPPMLHPNHNPLVASGRVSVSKPNINNMPRYPGVREIIVARPGYAFVDADYTQAELAGLAQICLNLFGFSRMAEIINTGRDLHCAFGAQLLGITYDEFVARYDAGDKACKDARQLAKCFNFGAPGGLGAQKFSVWAWDTYRVRVTPAEVRVLKAQWLQTFPEIQLYFQWVNQQIGDRGVFTFKQHVSGRLRGGLGFCDGCNTGFQGLIADGAARALALFNDKALYDPAHPAYGARVVAQIYDEILVETPLDRVHETGLFLRQAMIDGMNVFTPDVPAKVTLEAMYRWTKNAKYKTDDLGRLVPFDTPPDYYSSALTGMTGAAS
jgi:DNA polymerase-1